MKRILLLLLMCAPLLACAQENGKFDCYCSVRLGGVKMQNILINLPESNGPGVVIDKNGEPVKVEYITDVFTYMGEKRWEYVTQFEEKVYSSIFTWFVFKKKFESIDEAYKDIPSKVERKQKE